MRQYKLLLIEPDRGRRAAVQQAFVARGWEVAMAATQTEGLALLDSYSPHWVIVAAALPDGDGGTVLRTVRAKGRARVAVLTGAADDARLAQIAGWNPSLLVSDPLDIEDLYHGCAGEAGRQSALG